MKKNIIKYLVGGSSLLFGLGVLGWNFLPTSISNWVVGLGFAIAGIMTLGFLRK